MPEMLAACELNILVAAVIDADAGCAIIAGVTAASAAASAAASSMAFFCVATV